MLDVGYWMLDAEYWMLDTGCWILDIGALDFEVYYKLDEIGHCNLATGHL